MIGLCKFLSYRHYSNATSQHVLDILNGFHAQYNRGKLTCLGLGLG